MAVKEWHAGTRLDHACRFSVRNAAPAIDAQRVAPDPNTMEKRRLAAKRWLLRWAWLLSTGVLVFGYVVIVALLTDHASWSGV